MNFFKIKTTWSNIELGLLKICVGSIYLVIGAYFHKFIKDYFIVFVIVFIITAIWTFNLWLKKMKTKK